LQPGAVGDPVGAEEAGLGRRGRDQVLDVPPRQVRAGKKSIQKGEEIKV